jgi:hypothetical protein
VTKIESQQQFCCCADATQKGRGVRKFELHSSTAQVVAASKLLLVLYFGHALKVKKKKKK